MCYHSDFSRAERGSKLIIRKAAVGSSSPRDLGMTEEKNAER
jgi:hypothetical protein